MSPSFSEIDIKMPHTVEFCCLKIKICTIISNIRITSLGKDYFHFSPIMPQIMSSKFFSLLLTDEVKMEFSTKFSSKRDRKTMKKTEEFTSLYF